MLEQQAYRLQRLIWRYLRPATRGVKLVVLNPDGAVLLIRNTYGDASAWVLPGGGVHPFETPERAARRELMEEVRCRVGDLTQLGVYRSQAEGKRDTIFVFAGETADTPVANPNEVAGCGFYRLDALPEGTSPATKRRIDEYRGSADVTGRW